MQYHFCWQLSIINIDFKVSCEDWLDILTYWICQHFISSPIYVKTSVKMQHVYWLYSMTQVISLARNIAQYRANLSFRFLHITKTLLILYSHTSLSLLGNRRYIIALMISRGDRSVLLLVAFRMTAHMHARWAVIILGREDTEEEHGWCFNFSQPGRGRHYHYFYRCRARWCAAYKLSSIKHLISLMNLTDIIELCFMT